MNNLNKLLEQKDCFKLICGAGNSNLQEVERLVALYAASGCRFFDLAASEEVLKAAQKGLDFALPKGEQKDYHFCISIGTKNDQHIQKTKINSGKCKKCEQCIISCPQKAINKYFKVLKEKCIGCLKCKKVCKHKAIEIYSENKSLEFSKFKPYNISCIELHISDMDEAETIWDDLCQNFEGILSICIGRKTFSDEQIAELLKKLILKRKPYTTIIQADGEPMTGGEDNFETTLPAIETGAFIKCLHLPAYLMLSGGTNSKTAQLCKEKRLEVNGIAVGSYARKIVKEFIERDDFLTAKEIFQKTLKIASNLVKSTQIN